MKLTASGDAALLAALHALAFEPPWLEADFHALLASPGTFAFLAEADGEAAGFILCRAAADESEILTLATAPQMRRRGVARALLTKSMAEALERGATAMFLEVAEDNTAAQALYAQAGFAPSGRRRGYYRRPGAAVDAVVLRVALNSAGSGSYVSRHSPRERLQVDRLERVCTEKGLRMTEQRRVVARVLSQASDHPDVEEVHRRAHAVDPHISIATVYRTVRLFEEAGILTRHDFGDRRSRYEEASETHHDHLIDMKSGRVIEFVDEEIEALQKSIARRLGYRLVDHRLELYAVPADD